MEGWVIIHPVTPAPVCTATGCVPVYLNGIPRVGTISPKRCEYFDPQGAGRGQAPTSELWNDKKSEHSLRAATLAVRSILGMPLLSESSHLARSIAPECLQ